MRDSGVGRVLVASLHEAIAETLPTRLVFYESWLTPEGLRDGTIGLAPLYAVLSFLRQEGAAYNAVSTKAGAYAVDWTVASLPSMRRRWILRLPKAMRRRVLLRRAAAVVRMSYVGNTVSWRIRRGVAHVSVQASVFCEVRERVAQPLCVFYASVFEQMAQQFAVPAAVSISSCRAVSSGDTCEMRVAFGKQAESQIDETVANQTEDA